MATIPFMTPGLSPSSTTMSQQSFGVGSRDSLTRNGGSQQYIGGALMWHVVGMVTWQAQTQIKNFVRPYLTVPYCLAALPWPYNAITFKV